MTRAAPRVLVSATENDAARAAADEFVGLCKDSIASQGSFCVALSGGSTPRLLYRLLGSNEFRNRVDWDSVQLFFGDERGVPPEHPDSNYGMVQRELLSRAPIPAENVHRMEAERPDIEQAARDYEKILRRVLPLNDRGLPRFDLIFLGLGNDGHTASLFPTAKGWQEYAGWVVAPHEKVAGVRRMTLALPVLNAARHVIFLVTGDAKAGILRRVIAERDASLPAQHVQPADGTLAFIVDKAAATRLG